MYPDPEKTLDPAADLAKSIVNKLNDALGDTDD